MTVQVTVLIAAVHVGFDGICANGQLVGELFELADLFARGIYSEFIRLMIGASIHAVFERCSQESPCHFKSSEPRNRQSCLRLTTSSSILTYPLKSPRLL